MPSSKERPLRFASMKLTHHSNGHCKLVLERRDAKSCFGVTSILCTSTHGGLVVIKISTTKAMATHLGKISFLNFALLIPLCNSTDIMHVHNLMRKKYKSKYHSCIMFF